MPRRILQASTVLAFLLVTASGLIYTVFRVRAPLPWVLTRYSHATMAPFQALYPLNVDVRAEGRRADGQWEPIDLGAYIPSNRGRRSVRLSLLAVADDQRPAAFRRLASLLLEREQSQGHSFDELRLIFDQWPPSPDGFESLRQGPAMVSTEVAHVP